MMKIDGKVIVDRYYVWSVRQPSTDGKTREVACPDGEAEARRWQKMFGGTLLKREGFITEPVEVAEESDETLIDQL